jgi:GWxTD domain-containing protein
MTYRRSLTVLICAAVVVSATGSAQEFRRPGAPGTRWFPVMFTHAVTVSDSSSPARMRVDVWYRVDRDFFISARANDAPLGAPLVRRGDVTVELIDSLQGNRVRAHEAFSHEDADPGSPSVRSWYVGVISLSAPPGTYRVQSTVEDLESRRVFTERSNAFTIDPSDSAGLARGAFFAIARRSSATQATLVPVNFGDDLLFGAPAEFVWTWNPRSPADTVIHVSMKFDETPSSPLDQPLLPAPIETTLTAIRSGGILPLPDPGSPSYAINASPTGTALVAVVSYPAEWLLLRRYALTVHASTAADSATKSLPVRMLWPDMPFSLRDIDNALDALRYVATERELDSLREGTEEAKRSNLESFWRKRAPNTRSAYSDLAAEYYRRVDHAIREFGTLRRPDGFRTDRGKVYILYGPPSRIERSLNPVGEFREVWTFDHLRKTFTFIDKTKTGAYVLEASTP